MCLENRLRPNSLGAILFTAPPFSGKNVAGKNVS